MERIGFSTGSLALSDFGTALSLLDGRGTTVIELSALRWTELVPLLEAIPTLDLSAFHHVSVHAPSAFPEYEEDRITSSLREVALARGWPVVVHPDAIHHFDHWAGFGPLLCIENMDRRKVGGRSAEELKPIFECFPDASFCLDVAHVRQVDPSMAEAFNILREFGDRLVQVHISDLDAASRHVRLTSTAIRAYQEIADLIPSHIPAVIESPARPEQIAQEIVRALEALGRAPALTA